jgi:hypothetical protein
MNKSQARPYVEAEAGAHNAFEPNENVKFVG